MRKRTIFLILLFLAVFFVIDRIAKKDRSGEFDTVLIDLDTNLVQVIRLTFPSDDSPILLVREPQGWIASFANTSTPANAVSIHDLLEELSLIEVSEIASKKPVEWSKFGVGENQGVRVEILGKGEQLEDFVVGVVGEGGDQNWSDRFIRLSEQKEVFRVNNPELEFITQGFNYYRNKQFFSIDDQSFIRTVALETRDTFYQFQRTPEGWKTDQGQNLDSLKMEAYLDSLVDVRGAFFADNFDETRSLELFFQRLTFVGNNGMSFSVDCFRDSTWENRYVLHSMSNPDSWFESDASGLYSLVFGRLVDLIPQ